MKPRRGMTIIETLASLGLLSALIVVCVGWMTTTLSRQDHAAEEARWHRSAQSVLDLIGHDLFNHDALDPAHRGRTPRVLVEADTLHIRTRDRGRLGTARFMLDTNGDLVRLGPDHSSGAQYGSTRVPLLGGLAGWTASIDEPGEDRVLPVLHVALESDRGWAARRAYTLDPEDVR